MPTTNPNTILRSIAASCAKGRYFNVLVGQTPIKLSSDKVVGPRRALLFSCSGGPLAAAETDVAFCCGSRADAPLYENGHDLMSKEHSLAGQAEASSVAPQAANLDKRLEVRA